MRKYSIAMVAACPFPANHGTPAAIREMSEELVRRGHTVRVVTYPLTDNIPISGVAIDRVRQIGFNRVIKVGPNYQRLIFDFLLIFKLMRIVRRHQIDVIHAHNYEAALVAGIVGRLSGLPVIYNAINTMIGELPSFGFIRPRALAVGLAKLLDYATPRVADAVIADTAELHRFLLDLGVEPQRVSTINSGVRPEMFEFGDASKVRRRLAFANQPLIIYTGTFDEFQGVDYLLAAFKIVHQHDPLAKLVLVGNTINPTHRIKYARMAEKLGVASRVTITSCAFEELPDFLAAADIAVVPRPESAGIPTKLLNYMAAGKAIVSFEKSATILENGKTGRLVAPATAEGLAEAIVSLLADRDLASELGRNARSFALRCFDWSSIVQQIEGVYDKVLAEHVVKSRRPLASNNQPRGRVRAKRAF
jgi:1,2-diacylglycerol 3-alpha-glucosyltransferase